MANQNSSPRPIAEYAETEAILELLGHVERRGRTPKSEPDPEPELVVVEQAPASAFIIYEPSADLRFESEPEADVPPPLPPPEPERYETAVPMQSFAQSFSWETVLEEGTPVAPPPTEELPPPLPRESPRETVRPIDVGVPQPVGAMTLGEFFARMNWRNRPEEIKPLPLIGTPEPPRFDETVESVRNAFAWDDE